MIAAIAGCAFLTAALLTIVLWRSASAHRLQLEDRLEAISTGSSPRVADLRGRHLLRMQNYSSLPWLQRLLQGAPRAERIADDLERAGIRLRVGEYIVISVGAGVAAAFVGALLVPAGPARLVLMLLSFLAVLYLSVWWVRRCIRHRRAQIEAALPAALDTIARSLRIGSGLLAAIDAMIEQLEGPIATEFSRLQQEIGTGLSVEEAFRGLDRRVRSKDLHIVVTAILIQREVGGNLTEILANVVGTMRSRVRIRGELKALVSRQVFGSYVLAAIPPGVLLLLVLISRSFVQPLFTQSAGLVVLGIAALFEIAGFLINKWLASSSVEV